MIKLCFSRIDLQYNVTDYDLGEWMKEIPLLEADEGYRYEVLSASRILFNTIMITSLTWTRRVSLWYRDLHQYVASASAAANASGKFPPTNQWSQVGPMRSV